MSSMRKSVGFLVALALSAFAMPALAHYTTLVMTAGAPGVLTATVTNKTSGSYTINSIKIPFGTNVGGVAGATVTAYTGSGSTSGVTVTPTIGSTPGYISVPNVSLAYNKSITLTLSGVTPKTTLPSCAATSSTWTVNAYEDRNYQGYLYRLASSGNTLTVNLTPACFAVNGSTSAGGSVTCSPSTVPAGGSSNCSVAVSPGYSFTGFSANCSGSGTSCTVSNVQAPVTVTASFSQIPYAINGAAAPAAGGTVSCNPTSVTYGQSSVCSVTVNPGYTFSSFSGNCGAPSTATSCTVSNVQASQTVTATFSPIQYTVTGNGNPSAGGSLSCTSPVLYNGSSTCTATVNPYYTLTGFSSNCAPTTATSCTVSGVTASQSVTANFGANSLTISSPQSSAAVGAAFSVVVNVLGPDATVTLTPSGCPSLAAGSYIAPASNGQASFSLTYNAPTVVGGCTLVANATNYPPSGPLSLTVFAVGSLACGNPNSPDPTNTIIASAPGVNSINDPGFAEGVRGQNAVNKDGTNGAPCVEVNWTFTNNVVGTGTTLDAKGNTIPVNGVSFVWDQALQPNAAYSYTVTWQPEWFGLASAVNRKTQFCADAAPNACNIVVNAQACTSPALARSSIPLGAPACVSAEVWAVVGTGMCTGSPGPGQNACVIFTTTITDIKDPPIIRN